MNAFMTPAQLAELATTRYTTKAFDSGRRVPDEVMGALRTLLRFTPSSVNSQPWHFVVAGTSEGRARVAKATQAGYAYNEPKIVDASHVVVLCSQVDFPVSHIEAILDQEQHDGRFSTPEARVAQKTTRTFYADLHRYDRKDQPFWMEKQVYIALGNLLQGAAALGVDACPIEGFDNRILDEQLGLRQRGLTSVVLVALGYRSEQDFNANLPKSRLPEAVVVSDI